MISAPKLRRWLAGICLFLALVMLLLGLTVLAPRLKSLGFIVYWLVCFILTGAAALLALLDLWLLKRSLRHAEQDLIEQILRDAKKGGGNQPGA